ncbi:M3 family metallopeptidase [Pseudoalteromonas phenolica]|uniref:Peptidase M3 n=1 Tax=Pseudoalteromonas phenolica TaxID=161398 RepID=A0A0S2K0T8_9GAMM|nr:M3 family metallopeptidase [Pseudoalteromonas phenolica]ALO41618.1 peptidase M3 [Pseudoalteromonas phenolica]MBE0353832.1 peptidyl-dipeptidase Dcp [Pseudoalteromonas phenolica O-BC30]RXE91738.1 M3 family peptidase [Pseudoalteromonas phenolica O-BC30]
MKLKISLLSAAVVVALSACSSTQSTSQQVEPVVQKVEKQYDNILLQKYAGPYDGVPQFDKVTIADLEPALDIAIAENLAEIDAIANNPEKPTFQNTIVALEASGEALDRLFPYYGIWANNNSSPAFRELQGKLVPKFSAMSSKITQNKALFERIQAVYNSDEFKNLTAEEQRITWMRYNGFARNGATLSGDKAKRYAEINLELSGLHSKFGNNVLADEENYVVYLTKDQLAGLPKSYISAAAAAAKARGQEGKYAVTNTRSSMDPFLKYSEERELREQVWNNYYNRGNNAGENNNRDVISQILKLRHERIQLLGYENYAQWRLEDRMAKAPENAIELMNKVWPAAIARVKEEVADMQAVADKEGANITIAPWDYRFYAEKVRKAKYDLDSNEVKEYLQADKLTEAMFYVAGELFDFTFTPVPEGSVPVFHEDVKVWEVKRKSNGEHVGLFYLDPFARKGKRSGAWATSFRSHTTFQGKTNVLSTNNSNFVKAPNGEATLVSWDDANTYFHEFGHALHALSSNVKYPSSNGGVRDYTEFQSQLLERWLSTDEVINKYLVHYKTGKPMPKELIEKIQKSSTFNQGFSTTEYLASAIMDMKFHMTDPELIGDPVEFEKTELAKLGMPSEIVMRHRTTHFGHIFSGEGYSAGYYGYLWAEVLTSDAAEAFANAPGGFYDKDLGDRLVKYLFSVRNAMDPAEAYNKFRGRDAEVGALMRDRGFPVSE